MLRVNSLFNFRCVTGNISGTFDVKMAHTLEIQHGCQQNSGLKEVAFNHDIFGVFIGPFLNSVTVDFSSFIKVLVTNMNRFT